MQSVLGLLVVLVLSSYAANYRGHWIEEDNPSLEGSQQQTCLDGDGTSCVGCLGRQGICNAKSFEDCREAFPLGARWCGCIDNTRVPCIGCVGREGVCNGKSYEDCSYAFYFGAHWCEGIDCYDVNVDYRGNDLNNGNETLTDTPEECQQLCQDNKKCVAFTWVMPNVLEGVLKDRGNECWMKYAKATPMATRNVISGPRECALKVTIEKDLNYGSKYSDL